MLQVKKYEGIVTIFAVMLAVEYSTGCYDLFDLFIGLLSVIIGFAYYKNALIHKDFLFSMITSSLISLGIINIITAINYLFKYFIKNKIIECNNIDSYENNMVRFYYFFSILVLILASIWFKTKKNQMIPVKVNLNTARQKLADKFNNDLDESNKLWYGTIRLIITLSSSFLLLTLAVAQQLFPEINKFTDLSYFLIISWILLFFSIIFGIITEVDASIFHANSGVRTGNSLREVDVKLSQGIEEFTINMPDDYTINADIKWGVVSINSFIIAIFCLCLSFLQKLHFQYCLQTLTVIIVLLICLNIYLIKKRYCHQI